MGANILGIKVGQEELWCKMKYVNGNVYVSSWVALWQQNRIKKRSNKQYSFVGFWGENKDDCLKVTAPQY